MIRTAKEITELIQKKSNNARLAYNREWNRKYPSKGKIAELKGNMDAYDDCIVLINSSKIILFLPIHSILLINSSHLLDEDGRIAEARQLVLDLRAQGKSIADIIKVLGI